MVKNFVKCEFNDVSERDMDMLILEEFVCSASFTKIFTDRAGISGATVLSVHSSKTDVLLGESDITVVVESNGEKIGLLIEDKIDAIAMPEQAARYVLRGEKGIACREYDKFFVFIVAPRKYLSFNSESQKYPNRIEYETLLSYFEDLDEPRASFKAQQIRQAIEKQKKGYQAETDPTVTAFWHKYSEYGKSNYPDLALLYNGENKGSKATWPRFDTVKKGLYIYHKTEFGFVDMTFDGCAERIPEIERLLSDTLENYPQKGFNVQKTGKAASVRLPVPVLDMHKSFDSQSDLIKKCFDAISKMSDTARLFPSGKIYELLER